MELEIKIGEYAEYMPWKLHRPYLGEASTNLAGEPIGPVCQHIIWKGATVPQYRRDDTVWGYIRPFELAIVAECRNEAGCDQTLLCLECADIARSESS